MSDDRHNEHKKSKGKIKSKDKEKKHFKESSVR
jgi:hypothetical protein